MRISFLPPPRVSYRARYPPKYRPNAIALKLWRAPLQKRPQTADRSHGRIVTQVAVDDGLGPAGSRPNSTRQARRNRWLEREAPALQCRTNGLDHGHQTI